VQPPSAEQIQAMCDAVDSGALAISGKVDLAVIALDNAMANQHDAEAAVSAAMRNRDASRLAETTARLQVAQDGVRAAWQAAIDMLKQTKAVHELAVLARKEQANYDMASPGEAKVNAAVAVARLAADVDSRLRTVEALTLDLKKRWLLPLPSTGGSANDRAGTAP
jgi:3-dehydroquinate synthase class II